MEYTKDNLIGLVFDVENHQTGLVIEGHRESDMLTIRGSNGLEVTTVDKERALKLIKMGHWRNITLPKPKIFKIFN